MENELHMYTMLVLFVSFRGADGLENRQPGSSPGAIEHSPTLGSALPSAARHQTHLQPSAVRKRDHTVVANDNTCDMCGNAEENEYHTVVACTKSRALRQAMREHWTLPKEKGFWYTGEDWLQGLLCSCSSDERNRILLLLWRAWYLRENIVHGNGKESIFGSVALLTRYEQEVKTARDKSEIARNTCSLNLFEDQMPNQPEVQTIRCIPAPTGMAKLNTDAAYMAVTGVGAGDAIERNNLGQVYFSMGCSLNLCTCVEEAEGLALLLGLREMSKRYNGPVLVEVDCLSLANVVTMGATNKSSLFPIIEDIKTVLTAFRSYRIDWISREQNKVAHSLAARARNSGDFVQLGSIPGDPLDILAKDSA